MDDPLGHPSWHLSEEKMMMTHAKKVFHTICIIFARHDAFFPFLMTWQAFEQLNRFKAAKHSMGELIGTKFYREYLVFLSLFLIIVSYTRTGLNGRSGNFTFYVFTNFL